MEKKGELSTEPGSGPGTHRIPGWMPLVRHWPLQPPSPFPYLRAFFYAMSMPLHIREDLLTPTPHTELPPSTLNSTCYLAPHPSPHPPTASPAGDAAILLRARHRLQWWRTAVGWRHSRHRCVAFCVRTRQHTHRDALRFRRNSVPNTFTGPLPSRPPTTRCIRYHLPRVALPPLPTTVPHAATRALAA